MSKANPTESMPAHLRKLQELQKTKTEAKTTARSETVIHGEIVPFNGTEGSDDGFYIRGLNTRTCVMFTSGGIVSYPEGFGDGDYITATGLVMHVTMKR